MSVNLSTTLLNTLATAAQNAASLRTSIELDLINSQIDKQTKAKIAALKDPTDTVVIQSQQTVIDGLNQQLTQTNKMAAYFSANSSVFGDMGNNLAALQSAIAAGDATAFDRYLFQANDDLSTLYIIPPTAPYQDSAIEQFKTNGLGVKASSGYDLTTPAGQAVAAADVNAAQETMLSLSAIGTSNQLVAFSNASALTDRINMLTNALQTAKDTNDNYIQTQTQSLQAQAEMRKHLIQLALGNTTQLSTALSQMTATSAAATSPYQVLSSNATTMAAAISNPSLTTATSRLTAAASSPTPLLSLLT